MHKEKNTETDIRKIQNKILDIMVDIDTVCRNNGLVYYLMGGTLIGAVRHQGFIPWDDDLDILMPRSDYEKFLKIAPIQINHKYCLNTYDSDKYYPYVFSKIDDTTTTLIESSTGYVGGVYVDIFPLDGVPNNRLIRRVHFLKCAFYKNLLLLYFGGNDKLALKKYSLIKMFKRISHILLDVKKTQRKLDSLWKKYSGNSDINLVYYIFAKCFNEKIYDTQDFGKPIELTFEGHSFYAPKESEKYLKSVFGDFMKLPPDKDRVSHHRLDLVDLDNGYLK